MTQATKGALQVFDSPAQLASAVADAFVADAREAIAHRGQFSVALAGGTTPRGAYQLLAQEPRRSALDWKLVHAFFGDERCVPPESNESNFKMALETLLGRVPILPENIHRMRGEADPAQAAIEYAELLTQEFGPIPHFDLIMLGMGADGHTASLFPGTDPRLDEERLVRDVYVEKVKMHRLTITPLVINNARHVLIATEGLPKAPALYAVLKGPYDPVVHPVQIVAPIGGRLDWYVDRAAAAELCR